MRPAGRSLLTPGLAANHFVSSAADLQHALDRQAFHASGKVLELCLYNLQELESPARNEFGPGKFWNLLGNDADTDAKICTSAHLYSILYIR